jgi:hypothetical protein
MGQSLSDLDFDLADMGVDAMRATRGDQRLISGVAHALHLGLAVRECQLLWHIGRIAQDRKNPS